MTVRESLRERVRLYIQQFGASRRGQELFDKLAWIKSLRGLRIWAVSLHFIRLKTSIALQGYTAFDTICPSFARCFRLISCCVAVPSTIPHSANGQFRFEKDRIRKPKKKPERPSSNPNVLANRNDSKEYKVPPRVT